MNAQRMIKQWQSHASQVWSIDWSPQGDRVATGSNDGGAALWDAKSGELLHRVMPNQSDNNKNYLRVIDWSPTSELVATTHRDGYLRVFDAETGELKFRKRACGISCNVCSWSPDGEFVAAGGAFPNYEIIFFTTTGTRVGAIETHMHTGQWSPDGKWFATGGEDHDVTIWNVDTKEEERVLRYHFAAVKRLSWSPDSQRLVSVSDDGTSRVWNLGSTTEHSRLIFPGPASARIVVHSPNGELVAGGFADKSIRIWDSVSGKQTHNFDSRTAAVKDLSWSSDGKRIVSVCSDNTVWLWDLATGESSRTVTPKLSGGGVHPWVAWQPGTNHIALGELADRTRTYNALTGNVHNEGDTWVVTGRWSHHGTRLAQPGVSVLNEDLETVGGVKLRHDGCYRLCWSPNDRLLACAGEDGRLRVIDLATQKILDIGQGHGHMIRCVAWHPSGTRIASGGDDGKIILWDAATLDTLWNAQLPMKVLSLDWSPDGRFLVSSHGNDGQVMANDGEPSPEVRIWGSERMAPSRQETALLNTAIAHALERRERDREVATAILQAGGQMVIAASGELRRIEKREDLPAADFQLMNINLEGVPVSENLFRQLCSGLVLHQLNLRDTGLADVQIRELIGSLSNTKEHDFDATRREFRIEADGNAVVVVSLEDELTELNKAIETAPTDVKLVRQRADLYTSQSMWSEALADYQRVMEIKPTFTWEPVCATRAALMMGDIGDYRRRIAVQMEKIFDRTLSGNTVSGDFVASTAALAPSPDFDLERLLLLSQAHSDANRHLLWASRGVIVLHLRLGNTTKVLELLKKYQDAEAANERIFLSAVRSLVNHQLGNVDAAEEALANARQLAGSTWVTLSEGERITYSDFGTFVEAKVLLGEAEQVVGIESAAVAESSRSNADSSDSVDNPDKELSAASQPLIDDLNSKDSTRRLDALKAIQKLGPDAAFAVSKLVQLLKESESYEKTQVIRCLGRIGPDAAPAVPQLLEILQSESSATAFRYEAAQAIARMGEAGEVAIPTLIAILKDPGESVKSYLKKRTAPSTQGLMAPLLRKDETGVYTDRRDMILMHVISSLAAFGRASDDAIRAIERVRDDPDTLPAVKQTAERAIEMIGQKVP